MSDDLTPGEIGRTLTEIKAALTDLAIQLNGLSTTFVPRREVELSLAGLHGDIAATLRAVERNTANHEALESRVAEQERDVARRFRNAVVLVLTIVVAPMLLLAFDHAFNLFSIHTTVTGG